MKWSPTTSPKSHEGAALSTLFPPISTRTCCECDISRTLPLVGLHVVRWNYHHLDQMLLHFSWLIWISRSISSLCLLSLSRALDLCKFLQKRKMLCNTIQQYISVVFGLISAVFCSDERHWCICISACIASTASSTRCGLLLQTSRRIVVYLSVCWPRPWALQKRMNRSRCRSRADSHGLKEPCIRLGWHWRHQANTIDRSVMRRRCGLSLPLQ